MNLRLNVDDLCIARRGSEKLLHVPGRGPPGVKEERPLFEEALEKTAFWPFLGSSSSQRWARMGGMEKDNDHVRKGRASAGRKIGSSPKRR